MKGTRPLTDEEIESVYSTLESKRDRALWILGCKTGLRVSELLSLKVSDVLEHGQIGVQVTVAKKNTKGKIESKTLPLTETVKKVLSEYLDGEKDPSRPLFKSTKSNRAITRMQAHRILKGAFNALKLSGKVATHSMRKSYARKVHVALGNDILKTQIALCHKSLSSTSSYLQVDKEEVVKAILSQG
jgi:site-specific recombinase XerD